MFVPCSQLGLQSILQLFPRLKVSEKGRTDQCGQLEQADYELGQTKRNLSSLEKKYQATEAMLTEKTSADQENTHVIDTMKR